MRKASKVAAFLVVPAILAALFFYGPIMRTHRRHRL